MFGGMEWIIFIIIVALLLFGAKKIPEFAQNLGRAKAEFQRGQMLVEREIQEERAKNELKQKEDKNKVTEAAKALGIDTEGKNNKQLKAEIAEKLKE